MARTNPMTSRRWACRAMLASSLFRVRGQGGEQAPDRETHVVLTAGELTAVVGDNSSHEIHQAGYNGVWSLRHSASQRDLFVPRYAGFNLEHIITGEGMNEFRTFFEPRFAPMTLSRVDESTAQLHQPPTPTFAIESWTTFRLTTPHYLDVSVRFRPHQQVFRRGYLSLFWASYMNAPADKSMYFLGGNDNQKQIWTQLCTQGHNDQSTVRHRNDKMNLSFPDESRDALFKNLSPLRFDLPFFYGLFDDLVFIVIFDRPDGIRLVHSPSGGGTNLDRKTTNPAWDFQYVVPNPAIGKEYKMHLRTILRPQCSRAEILAEFARWRPSSPSTPSAKD